MTGATLLTFISRLETHMHIWMEADLTVALITTNFSFFFEFEVYIIVMSFEKVLRNLTSVI